MLINCICNPEHATRYQVFDNETGEDIRDIAWADDEAGRYAVFLTRKRTMSDTKDVDLRRRRQDGSFVLEENEGNITIVDTAENPLKGPFLALLNDPEVVEAIGAALSRQDASVGTLVQSLADNAQKFRDGIGSR